MDRNILVNDWLIFCGLPRQHWRNCLEAIEKLWLVQMMKPKTDQRLTAVQNSSLVWSWAHTSLHLTGSTMLSHGLLQLVSKWLINTNLSCFLREHLKLKWGFPVTGCPCWWSSGLFLAYVPSFLRGYARPSECSHLTNRAISNQTLDTFTVHDTWVPCIWEAVSISSF